MKLSKLIVAYATAVVMASFGSAESTEEKVCGKYNKGLTDYINSLGLHVQSGKYDKDLSRDVDYLDYLAKQDPTCATEIVAEAIKSFDVYFVYKHEYHVQKYANIRMHNAMLIHCLVCNNHSLLTLNQGVTLTPLLCDYDDEVRRYAVGIFSNSIKADVKFATPEVIGGLRPFIKDPDVSVRLCVAATFKVIAKLLTLDQCVGLIPLLCDDDSIVRRYAVGIFCDSIEANVEFATPEVIDGLRPFLDDSNIGVRGCVAAAFEVIEQKNKSGGNL